MSIDNNDFQMRIVSIDYTIVEPTAGLDQCWSTFFGQPISHVPILRLYGSTPFGQKCCLHLRNVFPYLFVEFPLNDDSNIKAYSVKLGVSIDHALALTSRDRVKCFVYDITPTLGTPFYGFSIESKIFLKIKLLDPDMLTKVANLLRDGAIFNTRFNIFEAHLPFPMQVFADYNLYGMGNIKLSSVKFRTPIAEMKREYTWRNNIVEIVNFAEKDGQFNFRNWHKGNITYDMISPLVKQTTCELECDALGQDILNKEEIIFSPDTQEERKLVQSLAYIWEDEASRRHKEKDLSSSEISITPLTPHDSADDFREENIPMNRFQRESLKRLQEIIQNEEEYLQLNGRRSSSFQRSDYDYSQAVISGENFITANDIEIKDLEPDIDENMILTQANDKDLHDILLWMLDDDIEEDQSDEQGTEQENIQECIDILNSQKEPLFDNEVLFMTGSFEFESPEPPSKIESRKRTLNELTLNVETHVIKKSNINSPPVHTDIEIPKKDKNFSPESPNEEKKKVRFSETISNRLPEKEKREQEKIEREEKLRESKKMVEMFNEGRVDFHSLLLKMLSPEKKLQEQKAEAAKKENIKATVDVDGSGETLNSTLTFKDEEEKMYQTGFSNFSHDKVEIFITPPEENTSINLTYDQLVFDSENDHPLKYSKDSSSELLLTPTPTDELTESRHEDESSDLMDHSSDSKQPVYLNIDGIYIFKSDSKPPNVSDLKDAKVIHTKPYFSNPVDLPSNALKYAGMKIKHYSRDISHLPQYYEAEKKFKQHQSVSLSERDDCSKKYVLVSIKKPPTLEMIKQEKPPQKKKRKIVTDNEIDMYEQFSQTFTKSKYYGHTYTQEASDLLFQSQIEHGDTTFKNEVKVFKKVLQLDGMNQHLTVMTMEIFAMNRGEKLPNPSEDAINVIFYSIRDDTMMGALEGFYSDQNGYIICKKGVESINQAYSIDDVNVNYCENEIELIESFCQMVVEYDVDILIGYEVQQSSLGYLIERGEVLGIDICSKCARIATQLNEFKTNATEWSFKKTSGIYIAGRIILNMWRIMRSELQLRSYTYENIMYNILKKRVPFFNATVLTNWFLRNDKQWKTLSYFMDRVSSYHTLIESLDIIGRTSEMARLYGIDFYSVLSRGSQYRVESMLVRQTKPKNYVMFSPSKPQVVSQKAPECIPLVMEPESKFYVDPVIVLDFQSLYPSIMIAHNYCYSTCLGKLAPGEGDSNTKKYGTGELKLPHGLLNDLSEFITISPNNVMFVNSGFQRGVLPNMLNEILNTRIMVKNSMKRSDNKSVYRMLDARQMGLKMIANVTYGYTGASFSGRMPCVDIADSIVQKGRETLENAISLVNKTKKWNARVIYGDTDSLFVLVEGASRERAFEIGEEIAKKVTSLNPNPVKLKFEKIYHPCILVAKKRYVGYKYESKSQIDPIWDAKGIETVRRDNIPALGKIMKKSLTTLFDTKDLSKVKEYLTNQWVKILTGRVSLMDFILQPEVKMGSYKNPPAHAVVCTEMMRKDTRAEPRYKERVPYVVVAGPEKKRLSDLVHHPYVLIKNPHQHILGSQYYIKNKINPALGRIFKLVGVDIDGWFTEVPKKNRDLRLYQFQPEKKTRIDHYYMSKKCPLCDQLTMKGLCDECKQEPTSSMYILKTRENIIEKEMTGLNEICMYCTNERSTDINCSSLDCPTYFERMKKLSHYQNLKSFIDNLSW